MIDLASVGGTGYAAVLPHVDIRTYGVTPVSSGTAVAAAWQDATDDLGANGGGVVVFSPAVWDIQGRITQTHSNVHHVGYGATLNIVGIDGLASTSLFRPEPTTRYEAGVALTANVSAGARAVTVADGSGFAAGDWIVVVSDALVGISKKQRDVCRIRSVSGNTLTLSHPLLYGHTTADAAAAHKMLLLENVGIHGFRFTWDNTSATRIINAFSVHGFVAEDLQFDYGCTQPVMLTDCVEFTVQRIKIAGNTYEANSFGYGVTVAGASAHGLVTDLVGSNLRHLFTTLAGDNPVPVLGGTYSGPNMITVADSQGGGANLAVFDTHDAAHSVTFDNCHAVGSDDVGFQLRSTRDRIIACSARHNGVGGVRIASNSTDVEIAHSDLSDNGDFVTPEGSGIGIQVGAGPVDIHHNRIVGNAKRGLNLAGDGHNIYANEITGNATYAIQDVGSTNCSVVGNDLDGDRGAGQLHSVAFGGTLARFVGNICTGYGAGDAGLDTTTATIKYGNITDTGFDAT